MDTLETVRQRHATTRGGWRPHHTLWFWLLLGWTVSAADRALTGPVVTWMIGNHVSFLADTARLPVALAVTAGAGGRDLSQRLSKVETAIFRRKTIVFDYYTIGRDTTEPQWSNSRSANGATTLLLKDVNIDDWFFGVSSVSADGYESPVEFPGPAGAFSADAGAAQQK